MERQLPTINIAGVDFMVDVTKDALVEVNNPRNSIDFYLLKDTGENYVMEYNPITKRLSDTHHFLDEDNPLNGQEAIYEVTLGKSFGLAEHVDNILVKIPQLVKLDPIGMSLHYNLPPDQLRGKTDFEIIVDPELFRRRLSGQQVTLEIVGKIFVLDMHHEVLRPKDDFQNKGIRFKDMMEVDDDGTYQFFYHSKQLKLIQFNPDNLTSVPKDIHLVEIPNETRMDAIGWALAGGWSVKEEARRFPPQRDLKAKIIPWEETMIHQIIKENLQRMGLDKNKLKAVKPRKKHSRKL